MKNTMKGLKKKSGFTLVEIIVVIGIIGVLAGILIPTFRGYVLSANKANDKAMAKQLYDHTKITMIQDWDAWNSFYSYNTGKVCVNKDGYNEVDTMVNYADRRPAPEGYYYFKISAKMDGAKPYKGNGYHAFGSSKESQYFAASLNKDLGLSTISEVKSERDRKIKNIYLSFKETDTTLGKYYFNNRNKAWMFPIKYSSFESQFINVSNGNYVDRWLIGFNETSPNVLEIWLGYSGGAGESGPRYRVYPNPFEEYTRT